MDPDTGIISNTKTFENVPEDVLPFKFSVTARDNPSSPQDYNVARVSVVVSGHLIYIVIHRVVLIMRKALNIAFIAIKFR